jgi:hypothetical protein
MLTEINLLVKVVILEANEKTLSRFSEEEGDNSFTFGVLEYTNRNNIIRKNKDKLIKIIEDNKNTIFKIETSEGKKIHILGKAKSKTYLNKINENNPVRIDYDLFESFRNNGIIDIYYSILKDDQNRIFKIYRTDENIFGKMLNHYEIYNNSEISDNISEDYKNENSFEEEEPNISLK